MPTIKPVRLDDQTPNGELLREHKDRVAGHLNFFGALANAPAVFNGYLSASSALGQGVRSDELSIQIALTVSNEIGSPYCINAYRNIAKKHGVSNFESELNISGISSDSKTGLILDFVRQLTRTNGQVRAGEIQLLRSTGITDEEILEIVGNTVLNMASAMINHIAGTEIEPD